MASEILNIADYTEQRLILDDGRTLLQYNIDLQKKLLPKDSNLFQSVLAEDLKRFHDRINNASVPFPHSWDDK